MERVRTFLNGEWRRYLELPKIPRALIDSYAVYQFARPVFDIFLNAFLWRHFGGITAPVLYNLGRYVGLPIGFYLNGFLLKRVKISTLYLVGLLVQSGAIISVIVIPSVNFLWLTLFAVVFGIGRGLYNGCDDFLASAYTKERTRNYFTALRLSVGQLMSIASPVLIGWFIASLSDYGSSVYGISGVYGLLALVALFLHIVAGYQIAKHRLPSPSVTRLVLYNPPPPWKRMRLFTFLVGIFHGAQFFIPVLAILTLVGGEQDVGIIKSIGVIVTAAALYWFGRISKVKDRQHFVVAGVWMMFFGALMLTLLYNSGSVVLYSVLVAMGAVFMSEGWSTIFYSLVNHPVLNKGDDLRYAFVVDHSLFLSIGSVVGTTVFLAGVVYFGSVNALRFVSFALVVSQFFIIPLAQKLNNWEASSQKSIF